jgi:hypothetical protein
MVYRPSSYNYSYGLCENLLVVAVRVAKNNLMNTIVSMAISGTD